MIQKILYSSQIGNILFTIKDETLVSLSFSDEREMKGNEFESICKAKVLKWLDNYFLQKNTKIDFDYSLEGCTSFQKGVFEEAMKISYGQTISYQELSERVKEKLHKENLSCQAIGQALKKNPIALVIPCHRIVGKNDSLVGYAYGIRVKRELIQLEKSSR